MRRVFKTQVRKPLWQRYDTNEKALEYIGFGASYKEIKRVLGISYWHYKRLKEEGNKISKEQRDRDFMIHVLLQEGKMSMAEIGRRAGINEHAVQARRRHFYDKEASIEYVYMNHTLKNRYLMNEMLLRMLAKGMSIGEIMRKVKVSRGHLQKLRNTKENTISKSRYERYCQIEKLIEKGLSKKQIMAKTGFTERNCRMVADDLRIQKRRTMERERQHRIRQHQMAAL